jgi:hypothetical protein
MNLDFPIHYHHDENFRYRHNPKQQNNHSDANFKWTNGLTFQNRKFSFPNLVISPLNTTENHRPETDRVFDPKSHNNSLHRVQKHIIILMLSSQPPITCTCKSFFKSNLNKARTSKSYLRCQFGLLSISQSIGNTEDLVGTGIYLSTMFRKTATMKSTAELRRTPRHAGFTDAITEFVSNVRVVAKPISKIGLVFFRV